MSNNKQSSVEWLYDNLNKCFEKFDNGEYSYTDFVNASKEVKQQAKTMHEKEIIIARSTGLPIEDGVFTAIDKAHKYYNETFGGNK